MSKRIELMLEPMERKNMRNNTRKSFFRFILSGVLGFSGVISAASAYYSCPGCGMMFGGGWWFLSPILLILIIVAIALFIVWLLKQIMKKDNGKQITKK